MTGVLLRERCKPTVSFEAISDRRRVQLEAVVRYPGRRTGPLDRVFAFLRNARTTARGGPSVWKVQWSELATSRPWGHLQLAEPLSLALRGDIRGEDTGFA